jgi:hypothetical protein
MMFFKRLFGHKEKPAEDPLHGVEVHQTQAEQDATRKHMESEVASDRKHRGASDARPGGDAPPAPDA